MNTHKNRRWLLIIGSLVGTVIIAVATILVLKTLMPQTSPAQSPKEVIELFTANAPAYLEDKGYKKADKSTNTLIHYTAAGEQTYDTYLTASLQTLYIANDSSAKDVEASIITKYEALYKKHGLLQSSSNKNVTGYLTKQFENDAIVCQTDQWQKNTAQNASYGIACIEKSAVAKAYEKTDTLLAKASSDVTKNDIRLVTMATHEPERGKQIITLNIKKPDSLFTLYFLNTTGEWSYIGMRPTPDVDTESSFAIPDKLTAAIEASPERALLTSFILHDGRSYTPTAKTPAVSKTDTKRTS